MNDETIDAMERDYVRGFNDGYVIAEQLPELARQLSHKSLDAPWFEGFRDGREQFVKDQVKEMRPDWLRGDRHGADSDAPEKDQTPDAPRPSDPPKGHEHDRS